MSAFQLHLREAVAAVVSELQAPITREDLVQRVLALHPSHARRPADLVIAELRRHTDLVRLDDGRYTPPDWILRGLRFRHVPTAQDAVNGIIPIFPCFIPFLLAAGSAENAAPALPQIPTLIDQATGKQIPCELIDLHGALLTDAADDNAIHYHALQLRSWFREHQMVLGDNLLFTVEDPKKAVFLLSCEAASDADRAAIGIQDATLEAELVALVERNPSEQPFIEEIIPAALARLHEAARRYPGNHWYAVATQSSRLRTVDDYGIARSTFRRPIDRLLGYTGSPASEKQLAVRVEMYNAEQARILEVLIGGETRDNDATLMHSPDEALRTSMLQIGRFIAEENSGMSTEDRCRCLAVPAVYLAKHEGVSLADATLPMYCRFLLSYYPRRVLFNRKAFTGRMLSSLRLFYEVQFRQGHAGAEALPHKLSRLHGLTDRKIALLNEIDLGSPQSARLFGSLFPDADKEDSEVMTLALREEPYVAN